MTLIGITNPASHKPLCHACHPLRLAASGLAKLFDSRHRKHPNSLFQAMVFDLAPKVRLPLNRQLYRFARPLIERVLHLHSFNAILEQARQLYANSPSDQGLRSWLDATLQAAGIQTAVSTPPNDKDAFYPGPIIAVANRPFGLLDACIIGRELARHRGHLLILGSPTLAEIPELSPWVLPFETRTASTNPYQNHASLRSARQHLLAGGTLLVFPATDIAHWRLGKGISESPWNDHAAQLALDTRASILPVFLQGQNSLLFQGIGLLDARLRRTLTPREFCHHQHQQTHVHFGSIIPYARLQRFATATELTRHLRLRTLLLGIRPATPLSSVTPPESKPVCARSSSQEVIAEVHRLSGTPAELARSGSLQAFIAQASDIPHLLQEIGRLREITFRLVGEGTGKAIDLDTFDAYYLHLFLWDTDQQRLVGAYRLGIAHEILRHHGPRGLYTSTLFKFKAPFLQHLDDAVEMGRSFIAPEYQRTAGALPLLWKAISLWMSRNPRYRKLFGPVSISQDYATASRHLMVEYLRDHCGSNELSPHVRPRHPFRPGSSRAILREIVSAKIQSLEDCTTLVSSLEMDQKGLPILLKHYLRLNGKLLSFNVDKTFSSVVDGLILVDLTRTDPRLLAKYMGEARCRAYLEHHGLSTNHSQVAED